jgi:hypothetical protein
MPEPNLPDRLLAIRDLLREARVQEADNQLNDLSMRIAEELERQKRDLPPPTPLTLAELQIEFARQVTDLLGNPPRLTNLVTEIQGKSQQAP